MSETCVRHPLQHDDGGYALRCYHTVGHPMQTSLQLHVVYSTRHVVSDRRSTCILAAIEASQVSKEQWCCKEKDSV